MRVRSCIKDEAAASRAENPHLLEAEQRLAQLRKELASCEDQMWDVEWDLHDLQNQFSSLEKRRRVLTKQINEIKRHLKKAADG